PDPVDDVELVGVHAQHLGAGVVDDVDEVVGGQPEVHRDQDRAELRHGVEGLQLRVCVGGDVGDTVALHDAHGLQGRGPAVTAVEELLVGQTKIPIDHRFPSWVQTAGTASELQGAQCDLHGAFFL